MEGHRDEKVYVALGNELQEGYKTLEWALRRWRPKPISIVIIHVAYKVSVKDYVYTPFGKLPASSVSDEKLKILRKYEQEKIDKVLSKYIAFCGKVKAEILNAEKYDVPIHQLILDLISGLHMTKLVMGFSFMKSSSSWRPKTAISGSFYIHQNKPKSCEFFIICGGKEVFLRGENDQRISMEDDQGVMVAKLKDRVNLKLLLGKMFLENRQSSLSSSTKKGSPSNSSQDQWEGCVQEIEIYFQQLSANLDDEVLIDEQENIDTSQQQTSPTEATLLELNANTNMSIAEKFEPLRIKIGEAHESIRLKKKEAKENIERHEKAEWAIHLCTRRAQELEAQIKGEAENRTKLNKELDTERERLHEVTNDIEESKHKLNSLMELQSEFAQKLHSSKMAKAYAEAQLESIEVAKRAEMVEEELEALRRERDVFRRRIEFCREKDCRGMAARLSEVSCHLREYTAEEIRVATDDFSERFRLKSGSDWSNVYRGRINHATVAIKILHSANRLSQEDLLAKVKLMSHIRHPHLLAMMGYCSQLNCIVFEYMHNGTLRDTLFSSHENSIIRNRVLRWQDRIRIATEICSAICYLHQARPKPVIHGHLSPSNILLDRNLVAKVGGFGLNQGYYDESHAGWDIRAFGVMILILLTGRNWVDENMLMDKAGLVRVLDKTAGPWPLDWVERLVGLVLRCLSINKGPNKDLRMVTIMEELDEMRKMADDLEARGGSGLEIEGCANKEDCHDVPCVFLCPIFQETMKDPHVAADGFSYEREAISEWLGTGHDTSPMTNLKLKHKILVPNHTLRSLIQDWHCKKSIPYP